MTPEQQTILMQLGNVNNQIYELNRKAEQLRIAMLPRTKPVKPITDWNAWLETAKKKRKAQK